MTQQWVELYLKFVPADELIVPYTATQLDDAEAVIHTC